MKLIPQISIAFNGQYHATLKIGDAAIMGGDLPSDRYEQPRGRSVRDIVVDQLRKGHQLIGGLV